VHVSLNNGRQILRTVFGEENPFAELGDLLQDAERGCRSAEDFRLDHS
jgi:hypothetical protein